MGRDIGCLATLAVAVLLLGAAGAPRLSAQSISGRISDAGNGSAVGLAAVIALASDRDPVVMGAADLAGYYRLDLPGPGEYYIVVERLGYFDNESPLLAVESSGDHGVDVELRPEPIRLDPLEVTVDNEELEDFLRLELGVHPATIPGYRSIQGVRLEDAKLKAEDNTDLLRWLYIPVSHGRQVCIGTFGAKMPERMTYERVMAAAEEPDAVAQCGALYVDGLRCRNEHIEEIDMDRIAVVVTFRDSVHMYTRGFDWTFRPNRAGGC